MCCFLLCCFLHVTFFDGPFFKWCFLMWCFLVWCFLVHRFLGGPFCHAINLIYNMHLVGVENYHGEFWSKIILALVICFLLFYFLLWFFTFLLFTFLLFYFFTSEKLLRSKKVKFGHFLLHSKFSKVKK